MNPKIKEHVLALIAENEIKYALAPEGSESFWLSTGSAQDKNTIHISFFCNMRTKFFSLTIGANKIIDPWVTHDAQTVLDAMTLHDAFKRKYESQNVDEVAIARAQEQKLIDALAAARKQTPQPVSTPTQPVTPTQHTECRLFTYLRNMRTNIATRIKGYQK